MIKKSKPVVHRIPITKARINLGQVVRRAHLNKECFILEKDGIPVAGIVDVDDLEDFLEVHDPKVQRQIKRGYEAYLRGKTTDAFEFLQELKSEFASKKSKKKVS